MAKRWPGIAADGDGLMYVATRMADTEGGAFSARPSELYEFAPQTSCGTTKWGENRLFSVPSRHAGKDLMQEYFYAIRDKRLENLLR